MSVPNRALEFKITKTWRKEGRVLIFLRIRDIIAFFKILRMELPFTRNKGTLLKKVRKYWRLLRHNLFYNIYSQLTSLPMCGFIAQLVEHRTGIAEVTGSNPVEALIFFRLLYSNCLYWKLTAKIIYHLHVYPQFTYESFHIHYISANFIKPIRSIQYVDVLHLLALVLTFRSICPFSFRVFILVT